MDAINNDRGATRREWLCRFGAIGALGLTRLTTSASLTAAESGEDPDQRSTAQTRDSKAAPAGGVPMLRYDAANTGRVENGTVPTESVSAAWTFQTDGEFRAQPIVDGGIVYAPNTDQTLYAIDAQTGDELWSRTHSEPLETGPVVENGLVYTTDGDDRILAYSAATGDGQFAASTEGVIGTLTLSGGTLYTRSSGRLRAFDSTSGELYWSAGEMNPSLSEARNRELAVTIGGESVYAMYSDDSNSQLMIESYPSSTDTDSPEREWGVGFGETDTCDTTVTFANGTLYAGLWGAGGLVALKPSDGSVVWRYENPGRVETYPTVTDDTVYATATGGELFAVDPALGTAKWSESVGSGGSSTSPVLVGGTLVFASGSSVYAFDTDGNQLWSFETGSDIVAPPVADDETIYVGSTDGVLYALEATDAGSDAPDVTGDGNPATDPDGDGVFEDVNGDGEFSIVDVQALFANLESDAVQSNTDKFDVNGDGQVDVTDVQALFAELQGE